MGMENIETADRRVGLIELDDLAPLLQDAGYTIISGTTIKEAVQRIISEWANGSFPILVADSSSPALYRWLVDAATGNSRTAVSVLAQTNTPEHINHDAISVVKMPFTLGQLAEEAGLGDIDEADAEIRYPEELDSEQEEDPGEGLPSFTDDDDEWDTPAVAGDNRGAAEADQPVEATDNDGDWDSTPQSPAQTAPAVKDRRSVEPEPEDEPELVVDDAPAEDTDEDDPYEQGLFHVEPETGPEPENPTGAEPKAEPDVGPPTTQAPAAARRAEPDDNDLGELFATSGSMKARRSPVISAVSGKGGVGKTTASIQLATAAAAAGYRTVLVDANRGQGDVHQYLRLNTSGMDIPTIADTLGGHARVRDVVLTADKITSLRPDNAEPVPDHLAVVLAPGHLDTSNSKVGPEHYLGLVNKLREQVDIVILDTQIIEAFDATGMVNRLVVPLLEDGGFGLSISDNSNPGMKNLTERLNMLAEYGVNRRKMLITINAADPSALRDLDAAARAKLDGRQGIYVGTIGFDKRIRKKMNNGAIDLKNRQLDQVVYETLYRATGDTAFDLDFMIEHANEDDNTSGGGFFSRLLRWRKSAR